MARGWHYTKLSLSSALLLYFFLACVLYYNIVSLFLSFLSRLVLFFVLFISMLSLELCGCFSDLFHVQLTTYRIGNHVYLLGMVETRSVNVKNTSTTTTKVDESHHVGDSPLLKPIWTHITANSCQFQPLEKLCDRSMSKPFIKYIYSI